MALLLLLLLLITRNGYRMRHLDFFFFCCSGNKTTLMASSKISFKPACVKAEHSLYEMAFIFFLIASPCAAPMGL